jgi:hypothetical protein
MGNGRLAFSIVSFILGIPGSIHNTLQLWDRAKRGNTGEPLGGASKKRLWKPILLVTASLALVAVGVFVLLHRPTNEPTTGAPPPKLSSNSGPPPPQQQLPPQHSESTHKHDARHRGGKKPAAQTPGQQSSVDLSGSSSITQSANAPCSGNSVTGNVDNNGCIAGPPPPPPARVITASAYAAAVLMLKRAPNGSTYDLEVIGGSREIQNFTVQLMHMLNDGGWSADQTSQTGTALRMDNGVQVDTTGFRCEAGNSEAAQIGLTALTIAGFPCSVAPIAIDFMSLGMSRPGMPTSNHQTDLYLSVGSRIHPPEQ